MIVRTQENEKVIIQRLPDVCLQLTVLHHDQVDEQEQLLCLDVHLCNEGAVVFHKHIGF